MTAVALGDVGALAWRPLRPGVDIHVLHDAGGGGPSSALLRYAPGAEVPAHEHVGFEHIVVLDGEQRDERGSYRAGTVIVNPPGSQHRVWSPGGCLVLVIWERPVRFLVAAWPHDMQGGDS
jgi:anti-sigma factor ChrR (cupin superfamily)